MDAYRRNENAGCLRIADINLRSFLKEYEADEALIMVGEHEFTVDSRHALNIDDLKKDEPEFYPFSTYIFVNNDFEELNNLLINKVIDGGFYKGWKNFYAENKSYRFQSQLNSSVIPHHFVCHITKGRNYDSTLISGVRKKPSKQILALERLGLIKPKYYLL